MTLDAKNVQILSAINSEPRIAASELSERVHLSRAAVSRRLNAMRAAGLFERVPLLVSYEALGFEVRAFVDLAPYALSTEETSNELLARPEVLRVSIVSGEATFLVEVVARNFGAFNAFMLWLQRLGSTETRMVFETEHSRISLEQRMIAAALESL